MKDAEIEQLLKDFRNIIDRLKQDKKSNKKSLKKNNKAINQ